MNEPENKTDIKKSPNPIEPREVLQNITNTINETVDCEEEENNNTLKYMVKCSKKSRTT